MAIVQQGCEFGMMVAGLPRIVMTDTIRRPSNLAAPQVKQRKLDRPSQARSQHVFLFFLSDCHSNVGSVRHFVLGIRPKRLSGKDK